MQKTGIKKLSFAKALKMIYIPEEVLQRYNVLRFGEVQIETGGAHNGTFGKVYATDNDKTSEFAAIHYALRLPNEDHFKIIVSGLSRQGPNNTIGPRGWCLHVKQIVFKKSDDKSN